MKPNRSNPLFTRIFNTNSTVAAIVVAVAGLASSQSAFAAAQVYQDSNISNVWDTTTANWDAGVVWTNGNTATFQGTGETVTVSAVTTNGITIGSSGYTLTGGTITLGASSTVSTTANATINSAIAGAAVNLSKSGAGTLTLGGTQSYTGNIVLNSGGNMVFASGFGTTSVAYISLLGSSATTKLTIEAGAAATVKYFALGDGSGASSSVDQTGGTVALNTAGNNFRIGHWDNGSNPGSVYNLSGGTLNTKLCTSTISHDGTGDMNVGNGASTATWQSGLINFDAGGADTKVGKLNLLSNGVLEANDTIGSSASGASLEGIHLAGGTARAMASKTWNAAIYADSNSTLEANGFTVTLTGAISGASSINLSSATGTVSFSTSSTQTVAPVLTGTTPITKVGTGTTTLTGANTHTGTLSINAGRLNVSGSLASATTIASGGTLGGKGTVSGDVTAASGSFIAVNPSTAGALTINNPNISGQPTISFDAVPTQAQSPVTLFNYTGTLTGNVATDLKGLSGFANATVSVVGSSVTLSFTSQTLVWGGGTGIWDVSTSSNWNIGTQKFGWGDVVTFDDTSGVPTAVTLTGELKPSSITVNSSTNAYSFTGSAGNFISGTTSLLKSGTSILTMNGPNTYTGGTVISQGTIYVQSPGALGTGTVTLGDTSTGANNIALYVDTNRVTFTTPTVISANGTGTATLGTRSTVGGTGAGNGFTGVTLARDVIFDSNAADRTDYISVSGTGNITFTGAGRSLLTNTNTFTGNITVSPSGTGGNLQIGTATNSGTNYIPDTSSVTVNDYTGATQAEFRLSSLSETINGLNGNGTVDTNSISTTLTVGGGNGSGSFSGTIQNSGANTVTLTKAGTGTQVLSGANTYTGVTTISAGILQFGKPASLYNATTASWTPANVKVASGATLAMNVGGTGEFTATDVTTLLTPLRTIVSNGLQAGSLVGFNTANAAGGTFTYSDVLANSTGTGSGAVGVRKLGAGTLVLSGANSYTGTTYVDAGTLEVTNNASGVGKAFIVAQGATLYDGFATSTSWGGGNSVVVNGTSLVDASGLYLKGGLTYQFGSTLTLQTAPSTVHVYGTGVATLNGGDVNSIHLSVPATGSGSVLDSAITVNCSSYGYRMNVASGANNATGDVVVPGIITGNGTNTWGGPSLNLLKYGTGSLKITGASNTLSNGVWIENGSIILSGGSNRLPAGNTVSMGDGAASGKLILDGVSQTLANVVTSGSGTANAVVGGSATLSTLNVGSSSDSTLSVRIGGVGTNEDNIAFGKSGTGILTLANVNNSYSGGTTVNAGTLRVNDSTGTVAGTGTVTVNTDGTLDGYGTLNVGVIVSATGGTVAGGIGAGSLSGDKLTVDSLTYQGTGALTAIPNVTQIEVTNTLTASGAAGSVLVNIGTAPLATGTYTLATHSGPIAGTGASAFTIGANPGGPFTYSISDNGSELQLTVATSALFWNGNVNTAWSTTNNWKTGSGAAVTYTNGTDVVFNDNASSLDVDLSAADVTPTSVTFGNSIDYAYTLGGSKAIAGSTALLKSGTGLVTINNTNSFTGDVTINQGTINALTITNAGVDSSLGKGSAIILGGGTLGYTGATATVTDRSVAINSPSVIDLSAGDLELAGIVSGSGALTKSGSSTLLLSNAANTLTGNITVTGGAVSVDDTAKLGSGSLTLASGTLALTGSTAITTAKAVILGVGGGTFNVSNTAGVTDSGSITGSSGFTKSGAGTLTFSSNKSITGGVTVNDGKLYLTSGYWYTNPFGATNTLTINAPGIVETSGAHGLGTDQNNVVINGGTLYLGREQYATTLKMTGGLVTGNADPATELRNWGGTMNFYASPSGAVIATRFNMVGASVLNVEDGAAADDLLISGPVAGSQNLTKNGDGKLSLQGINTYTSNTTVNAGTLELKDDARLTFVIPATGASNKLSGAGTALLDGDFYVNTTAAAALTTGSWTLEDMTGTATYSSSFQVVNSDGSAWTAAGDVWTMVSGSQLWTFDEATGILTLAVAGYDAWATQITNPADRDRTADPDSDGFTNLQEFLFGTNPTASNGALVTMNTLGGNLVLSWLQRETNAGYILKESTVLTTGSWSTSALVPALDGSQTGVPTDYDRWTVTIPYDAPRKFFRIEGTEN